MIRSWRDWLKRKFFPTTGRSTARRWNPVRKPGRRSALLYLELLETREVLDSGGAAGQLAGGILNFQAGGSLVQNVQIQPIFIKDNLTGNQTSAAVQAQLTSYFNKITTDTYITSLLSQYNFAGNTVGTGGVGAADTAATITPGTPNYSGTHGAISDAQIQALIDHEINTSHATAAANANNIYYVFTPPGDAVTAPGLGNSISNFVAYHSGFTDSQGHDDLYAVIPDPGVPNANFTNIGLSALGSMTEASSHELAETITDGFGSWYDHANGNEIGDLVNAQYYTQDGNAVQYEWSNSLKGAAHAPLGTGANDLFINQLSAPAVTGAGPVQLATFTDANTTLTAANFTAFVETDNNGVFSTPWTTTISGGNGHFVITGTPPAALGVGTIGTAFKGDGLLLEVGDNVAAHGGLFAGGPSSFRYTPFTVAATAPLTYNADSGGVAHNFVLKENTGTGNFELTDNGLLVFTQAIAKTTAINIGADPGGTVDSSLTVDYSGGAFTLPVTFDGGNGTGTHTLTIQGNAAAFAADTYVPTGPNAGAFTLGTQTITFSHVTGAQDLTTATNFTADGTIGADQINVVNGPTVAGTQTTEVNSGNNTFAKVDFANKTNATVQGLAGADTITANNSTPGAGLATLKLNGGTTGGGTITVQATPSTVVTSVAGKAATTVTVGNATNSVQGILGTVNLDNTAGALNTITVNDSGDTTARTVTLSNSQVHGLAPADINYVAAGTLGLTVDGGSGGNKFNVTGSGVGVATVVNGGTGSDTFNVAPQALGTNLTLNGQAPTVSPGDRLVYNGPGTNNPGGVGSGTITQTAHGTVTYTGIETVNIGADLSQSTLTVSPSTIPSNSTATVTFTAVDGNGVQETTGGLTINFGLLNSGGGYANGSFSGFTDLNNGVYTATFTPSASGTNNITATVNGVVASAEPSITVTPAATHIAVTTAPTGNITAGSTFTLVAMAEDNSGALDTTYNGYAIVTLGSGTGPLLGTTVLPFVNGILTVPNLSIDTVGAGYTLEVGTSAFASAVSGPFNVTPAPATHLVVTQPQPTVQAGSPLTMQVEALDQFGNLDTNYNATANVSMVNRHSGPLVGSTTQSFAGGILNLSGLSIDVPGTGESLKVTSGRLPSLTGNTFQVTAAAATHLVVTQEPGNVHAGAPISFQVEALDQFGHLDTNYNSAANLSLTGPGTLTVPGTLQFSGGILNVSGPSIDSVAVGDTLGVTSGGLASTSTTGFDVTPTATQLVVAPSLGSFQAGGPISFQVLAEDAAGRVDTSYAGTVSVSLVSGPSNLLGNTVFALVNGGQVPLSGMSLDQVGSYTLQISSSTLGTATTSLSVTPAAATHLAVATTDQPGNINANDPIQFTVQALDQFGNLDTNYNGAASLSLATGAGPLLNATGLSFSGGLLNVSGPTTIDTAGTGDRIQVNSGSLTAVTTNPFSVSGLAATQLAVTAEPGNVHSGAPISFQVQAQDQYHNLDTSYSGTASLSLTGPGTLTVPGTLQFFNGILDVNGPSIDSVAVGDTLGVTSGGLASTSTNGFDVTPTATQLVVTPEPASSVQAGGPISFQVLAEDAAGRVDTSYSGTVSVSVASGPSSTLQGTTVFALVNGGLTLSGMSLDKVGNYILQVSGGTLAGTPTSSFQVTPAAATHLAVSAQPSNIKANDPIGFTVQALDQYNNLDTNYNGTVSVALAANPHKAGSLTGSPTVTISSGVATLSTGLTIQQAATGYTLQLTSGNLTPVTTSPFDVSGLAANHLIVATPPGNVKFGTPITLVVEAVDKYGNLDSSVNGSVSVSLASGPGSLTGPTTQTVTGGIMTLSGVSIAQIGNGYTLQVSGLGLGLVTTPPFNVTKKAPSPPPPGNPLPNPPPSTPPSNQPPSNQPPSNPPPSNPPPSNPPPTGGGGHKRW